jgi:hypothetical protein
MTQTIEQIYDETIRPLPTRERMRLAKMILKDIPVESVTEGSDDWSEEDLRDAQLYAMKRASAL